MSPMLMTKLPSIGSALIPACHPFARSAARTKIIASRRDSTPVTKRMVFTHS
eukprot:COSAG02_NODE_65662_length_257_cov_0.981013_1_plen_51_part_01